MLRNLPQAAQQSPVPGLLDVCLQGLCHMLSSGTQGRTWQAAGDVVVTSWGSESD